MSVRDVGLLKVGMEDPLPQAVAWVVRLAGLSMHTWVTVFCRRRAGAQAPCEG